MMWDGFDKRRFPRLNLRCEINIAAASQQSNASPIKAMTENVGAGGVAVMLSQVLERFTTCKIRLELDPAMPHIEGTGKIVWTIPSTDPNTRRKSYDTGIEFTDISASDHELIRRFIQEKIHKGFRDIVPGV